MPSTATFLPVSNHLEQRIYQLACGHRNQAVSTL
jgi:hypothetical protein